MIGDTMTPSVRDCIDTATLRLNVQVGNWPNPINAHVDNFPASWVVSNWPTGFNVNNWPNPFVVQVGNFPASTAVSNFPASFNVGNFPASFAVNNFPASTNVGNWPASWAISNFPASTITRSDAQSQARSGGIYAVTSALVPVVLGAQNNVLTIANLAASGRMIYLASVNVHCTATATVLRIRNATMGGTQSNAVGAIASLPSSTARTGGTATGASVEAVTISGQADNTPSGSIRIAPGESLSWALTVTVLGSAAVSVQAWSEANS